MAYKCHNCDATLWVLRLGYCPNCHEPISSNILPESKKQALDRAEREYEELRERHRAQKEAGDKASSELLKIKMFGDLANSNDGSAGYVRDSSNWDG